MKSTEPLHQPGPGPWPGNLTRALPDNGIPAHRGNRCSAIGLTPNPGIFRKATAHGTPCDAEMTTAAPLSAMALTGRLPSAGAAAFGPSRHAPMDETEHRRSNGRRS